MTSAVLLVVIAAGAIVPHPAVISAAAVEAIAENAGRAPALTGKSTRLEAGQLRRAAREAVTEDCDLLPRSGLRPAVGERTQSAARLHESPSAGNSCFAPGTSAGDATIRRFVQSLLTRRLLADSGEACLRSAGDCLRL